MHQLTKDAILIIYLKIHYKFMTVSYKPDMSNLFIILDQNKHCIKVAGHINQKKKKIYYNRREWNLYVQNATFFKANKHKRKLRTEKNKIKHISEIFKRNIY